MQMAQSRRSALILIIPVSATLHRPVAGRIQSKQGSIHTLRYLLSGLALVKRVTPGWLHLVQDTGSPGLSVHRAKACWMQITGGGSVVVSRPTAAGLFTDSWSPQGSRPWSSEDEIRIFFLRQEGSCQSCGVRGSFCDSPSGVTKGDLKRVTEATQGGDKDLSCLRLPGGHAHGCERLLTSPVGLRGSSRFPDQHRGSGSQD